MVERNSKYRQHATVQAGAYHHQYRQQAATARLADSQRKTVYGALYSELDLLGMFCGMYFTGYTPVCWFEDDVDDEDCSIYDERKTKVNSYEEYWNAIFNDADNYMSDFSIEDMEAFGWLCEGTYRIHYFK